MNVIDPPTIPLVPPPHELSSAKESAPERTNAFPEEGVRPGGLDKVNEGPVPAPDGGLYFSDVGQNRTYKLSANGTISVWRENTNAANGLLQLRDGRLLAAECGCYSPLARNGRIVAVMPDGEVKVIAAAFNGQALKGPNDLIADKRGGIYFTDPGLFLPAQCSSDRAPEHILHSAERRDCAVGPRHGLPRMILR